jgi:plastocyanin
MRSPTIAVVFAGLCVLAAGCGDDASFADAAPRIDAPSVDAPVPDGPPPVDAPPVPDANLPDSAPPAVVLVDCPFKEQPEARVTVETFTPEGGPAPRFRYDISYLVKRSLRPGDVVEFQMSSSHNAVSGQPKLPDGLFRAEASDNGKTTLSTCFRFDRPGEYPFFCTFHPDLTAALEIVAPPT